MVEQLICNQPVEGSIPFASSILSSIVSVAQSGSAPALGAGGQGFKSPRSHTGGVAEWLKAAVLKTAGTQVPRGSPPKDGLVLRLGFPPPPLV